VNIESDIIAGVWIYLWHAVVLSACKSKCDSDHTYPQEAHSNYMN